MSRAPRSAELAHEPYIATPTPSSPSAPRSPGRFSHSPDDEMGGGGRGEDATHWVNWQRQETKEGKEASRPLTTAGYSRPAHCDRAQVSGVESHSPLLMTEEAIGPPDSCPPANVHACSPGDTQVTPTRDIHTSTHDGGGTEWKTGTTHNQGKEERHRGR